MLEHSTLLHFTRYELSLVQIGHPIIVKNQTIGGVGKMIRGGGSCLMSFSVDVFFRNCIVLDCRHQSSLSPIHDCKPAMYIVHTCIMYFLQSKFSKHYSFPNLCRVNDLKFSVGRANIVLLDILGKNVDIYMHKKNNYVQHKSLYYI